MDMQNEQDFRALITQNQPVGAGCYLLGLKLPATSPHPLPGQFYMVGVSDSADPLLKRPFCYFRPSTNGASVELLYRVVGKGTAILSTTPVGAHVRILGPLGNSYPKAPKSSSPVIVTGGIGFASVYPCITSLSDRATVIYGARSRAELLMIDELRALLGERLHICTDDGSEGRKGTVVDALMSMDMPAKPLLYVCGPKGMIHAVARWAQHAGIEGYASLEEYMACGIGACMGCVVKAAGKYRRVCKEGPIFKLADLEQV